MNFKLIFFLLLLFNLNVNAQSSFQPKIDSILNDLKTDLKPHQRISRNLKLVSYYKYAHPDVDSLIETSLAMAEKRGMKFFIARSLKYRARFRIYNNVSTDSIFADIQRIEGIDKQIDNKFLPVWISNLYASYYILISDLDKAKVYLDSLTVQVNRYETFDCGPLYTVRGQYFQKKMDYNRAIEEYKQALECKLAGRTFILNNLGRLHLELQNPKKAIEFAQESIALGDKEINTIPKIESLSIIGKGYLDLQDTITALSYFEKSEALRSVAYVGNNYTSLHHLIDIYKSRKPSAMDSLLEDLSSYKLIDEYPKLLAEKGMRSLELGNRDMALRLCKEGYIESQSRNKYAYGSLACDCLIEIYKSDKNTDLVNEFLIHKIDFQAKLNSEKRIISMARNLASFESDKEKALLQQAHEKDQKFLAERLGKYQLGGGLGLLLLVIGGLALRQLKKKNNRIASQNKVISKSLDEKDILLREIHHRVKNNLQLVSSLLTLQGKSITDVNALEAINEGKSRVRSMALIHQDLYSKESLTGISVRDYLEKLTKELFYTYNIEEEKIKLNLNIQDIELDVDTLVPLGLIINELITNSLKYAFPNRAEGILNISIYEANNKLILEVDDNGVGYDLKAVEGTSFGSTLISALTEQLEGKIQIKSENGTQVKIEFESFKIL